MVPSSSYVLACFSSLTPVGSGHAAGLDFDFLQQMAAVAPGPTVVAPEQTVVAPELPAEYQTVLAKSAARQAALTGPV
jgi:hypothetical protein